MFGTETQTICRSKTVYQLQAEAEGNIGGGKKYQHIYSQDRREEAKAGEVYIVSHLPTTFQFKYFFSRNC